MFELHFDVTVSAQVVILCGKTVCVGFFWIAQKASGCEQMANALLAICTIPCRDCSDESWHVHPTNVLSHLVSFLISQATELNT